MVILGVMVRDWDPQCGGHKDHSRYRHHCFRSFSSHLGKLGEAVCQIKWSSVQTEGAAEMVNSSFVDTSNKNIAIFNGKQAPT